jgi:hypothetical protein
LPESIAARAGPLCSVCAHETQNSFVLTAGSAIKIDFDGRSSNFVDRSIASPPGMKRNLFPFCAPIARRILIFSEKSDIRSALLAKRSAGERGTRCAAQAHTSPRSAPLPPGRPNDRATAESCARRERDSRHRANRPDQGWDNRINRRRAKTLRHQAGGTQKARIDTASHRIQVTESTSSNVRRRARGSGRVGFGDHEPPCMRAA